MPFPQSENLPMTREGRKFVSSLYERLALSRDKDEVMRLALEGQVIESPEDIFKDSYVLEFTRLPEMASYSESDLEERIIDHLKQFLLELGRGFTFVGRQMRFTFEEDHYRVDLVTYVKIRRVL